MTWVQQPEACSRVKESYLSFDVNHSKGFRPSLDFCGAYFSLMLFKERHTSYFGLLLFNRNGDKASRKQVYDPGQIFKQRQAQ